MSFEEELFAFIFSAGKQPITVETVAESSVVHFCLEHREAVAFGSDNRKPLGSECECEVPPRAKPYGVASFRETACTLATAASSTGWMTDELLLDEPCSDR
jgi:hypothetical protein